MSEDKVLTPPVTPSDLATAKTTHPADNKTVPSVSPTASGKSFTPPLANKPPTSVTPSINKPILPVTAPTAKVSPFPVTPASHLPKSIQPHTIKSDTAARIAAVLKVRCSDSSEAAKALDEIKTVLGM